MSGLIEVPQVNNVTLLHVCFLFILLHDVKTGFPVILDCANRKKKSVTMKQELYWAEPM